VKKLDFKILIIDQVHEILIEKLNNAGFNCHYSPDIKKEEIVKIIGEFHGLIIRSKSEINKSFIDKGNQLKFIGRIGSGMENIDVAYANQKGIVCINSPEGNRDAVAEHAVGMLLSLANNISIAGNEVKNGIWSREKNRGFELSGKTIGIIGYGNTGSAFAKKLSGFGMKIMAYDKYKSGFSDSNVTESNPETIMEEADILSLHIPYNNETHYLINSDYISKFRKNIILINTSRGAIVSTSDLVVNIKSGKIAGACLDVLEYEKSSFEDFFRQNLSEDFKFLISSSKVIITPHIAGWTIESNYKLSDILADKIIKNFKVL
jgi:D-3-phosphoglycerate dehydrogenase